MKAPYMMQTLEAPSLATLRQRSILDQLQGAWYAVAGRRHCRLLVAGTRYSFEIEEGNIYIGTFFLDDEAPRQMDMLIEEGPDDVRGLISLCLFHVDGDVLRWCPTRAGTDIRLRSFPSVEDERYLSLVMKRAPRRRPR